MFWDDLQRAFIDHFRLIAAVVGAILLVFAAAAGFVEWNRYREASAVGALFEARKAVSEMKADAAASEKVAAYEAVASAHGGTRAAYEARVAIADLYLEAKDYAQAESAFQQAVAAAPDSFAKVLTLYNRATAAEIAGNCAGAVEAYTNVLKEKGADFLRPELLLGKARCLESLDRGAEAISVYQEIQDKFPGKAYYANSAAVFRARLEKSQAKN